MGTTTSALLIAGDRGFIAHVGDSRIYMLRSGQVVQLTEDHSLINELIRRGKITKESFEDSPYKAYKNAVTRAVGVYETVQGDTIDFEILPGDQFLICSDGLHAYLDDAQIIDLLHGRDVTTSRRRWSSTPTPAAATTTSPRWWCASTARVAGAAPDNRAEELTRKIEVLKQMPLFRHLTYKEIIRVLNVTEVREFAAGAGDHQGRDAGRGDVHRAARQDPPAQERRLHHQPGRRARTWARWRWSTAARARSARSAEERSRVLTLRRREFYQIIRKDPSLSVKLLWSFVQVLADRLRKTTEDLSGARLEADALDMTDNVLFDE